MFSCYAAEKRGAWLGPKIADFKSRGVAVRLRKTDIAANIELESAVGGATLTLWETGMLDFIVLRPGATEPVATTHECSGSGDLRRALDEFLVEYEDAV